MTPVTAALMADATKAPRLWLPRVESHWAGGALGLLSAALGVAAANSEWPARHALGWVALLGLLLGMLLHWRYKHSHTGWRIDFGQRRIEPIGLPGSSIETVAGGGWEVQTAPGDRRHHVAIDLRHRDRGRVARLLEAPARGNAELRRMSTLADTLALRLGAERTGPRL